MSSSNDPRFVNPEEERERFLAMNIERIEQLYCQALEDDVENPIVVALDARDATSQEIIAAMPDVCGTGEVADENPAVVFSMTIPEATERIGEINKQAKTFIEHAMNMKGIIGKKRELMIFMTISFEKIECKLHPLPE